MVVIAGEARLVNFGRRDARSEVDRLYRKHADEVLRYSMLVLRSRPDAEDVVQATFMRALRSITSGERVQKPRNWLIKIAHNECRRVLSVRSRRAEVELQDVPSEATESGRADELRRALGQLAPNQREALVLRELEGRSYTEIAATLGLTGSAVETLIFRARRAVREQLESALACDEAVELIEADVVADEDRKRLRAHTRGCADCATLERQARGRKGALRRLASSIGLPWFGKVAAVALTVSAAATTTGVMLDRPAKPKPLPHLQQPAVSHGVAQRPVAGLNARRATATPVQGARRAKHASHSAAPRAHAPLRHTPATGGTAAAPASTAAASPAPTTAPPTSASSPEPAAAPPPGTVSGPKLAVPAATPPALPTDPVSQVLAPVTAVTDPVVAAVDPVVATVTEPLAPVTQPVTNAVSTVTTALPVALPPAPALTGPGGLLGHK